MKKMKIIISHDVDHLFRNDHYKDLIYPKLWVRSTIELLKKEYGVTEWFYRMLSPFNKVRNRIDDIMKYDGEKGIPSTFFFGMKNGLGMSYSIDRAKDVIHHVEIEGFDVGVHGISYSNVNEMLEEYEMFAQIIGHKDFGIRMHYVRFDKNTFNFLDKCGYKFDTTCFDKSNRDNCLIKPYKVGKMWEFPLNIMDGYLPPKLEQKKIETKRLISKAAQLGLPYLTILFHDYQFCKGFETEKKWYIWTINYLISEGYKFISYKDAIKELEENNTIG